MSYVSDTIVSVNYGQYEAKIRKEADEILSEEKNLSLTNFDFFQLKGIVSNEEYEVLISKKPATLKAMSDSTSSRHKIGRAHV